MSSDAISSTGLHPCGSVLATCSGQRHFSTSAYETLDNRKDGNERESDDGDGHSSTQALPHSHLSDTSPSCSESSASSSFRRKFDNSLKIWAW